MTTLETLMHRALSAIADEASENSLAQHIDTAKAALHPYQVAARHERTLAADLMENALEIIATDIMVCTLDMAREEARAGLENLEHAGCWEAAAQTIGETLELN